MSQQQVDAYRQQLLASYYQQQQQQQQQQQLNSTPAYYYSTPKSPVQQTAYSPSPSTMALLSSLQHQHEQEQQKRQLSVASPTPSYLTASYSPIPAHHQTAPEVLEAPSFPQEHYYQSKAPTHTPRPAQPQTQTKKMTAVPSKEEKLKKKKSFLAKVVENKNLSPKDPSFWSPRDAAQAKRFGRRGPKGNGQDQVQKAISAPAAVAAVPVPAAPPSAQHQQQAPPPPYQSQTTTAPAPPSFPAPPFDLSQIPSGGFLYYCPPTPQSEMAPVPAAAPAPETRAAQKPVYRVNATVYNPRQGNPGDRCTIM